MGSQKVHVWTNDSFHLGSAALLIQHLPWTYLARHELENRIDEFLFLFFVVSVYHYYLIKSSTTGAGLYNRIG